MSPAGELEALHRELGLKRGSQEAVAQLAETAETSGNQTLLSELSSSRNISALSEAIDLSARCFS